MKRVTLLATVALFSLLAPRAQAEVHTHAAAKISLDVPAGWKIENEGESLTINDPDDEIAVFLQVLDAADLEKAADAIAKVEGKPVDLGVVLVVTPAKKVLLVLGAVEKSKAKKHEKAITSLFASIKPAK